MKRTTTPLWAKLATILLSLNLLAIYSAEASPVTQRFYGYAYDARTGAYLYTEVHKLDYDGMKFLGGLIRYFSPAGRLIGEKMLDFSQDPYIPLTQFKLQDPAYEERITAVKADGIDMERIENGRRKSVHLVRAPVMAVDSGFHSFVVDHLDELAQGKTVPLVFGVVGKLASYKFRVRKVGTTRFDGREAMRLKVEPDSMLRFLVEPLILTYDEHTRYLLQYRGISNLIDPATGRPYNVRIDYVRQVPADAPANLPPLK